MKKGKLYLIPNVIAEGTQATVIPKHIVDALPNIQHFLAENIRTARRYLSSLKIYDAIEPLKFFELNKQTKAESLSELLKPINEGYDVGVISESGCPGVADPGAIAVKYAHEHDVEVVPLVGPSSLLLALMASGLNGQRFAFHGYLPIDQKEASKAIKELERESRQKNQTQIFIETPYRNNQLMHVLLKNLGESTWLTVALDLTGSSESIKTLPLKKWKALQPDFPKTPAVFLLLAV